MRRRGKRKWESRAAWPKNGRQLNRRIPLAASAGSGFKLSWKRKVAGKITASVVGGDTVYVAARDSHALYALDCGNGKAKWEFRRGAGIYSPPTVAGKTLYFGCRDGWVDALMKESGELAWKFRVVKSDRENSVCGQLESVWPVHGSVLCLDGAIYFAAGRSSNLDDGLYICKLDGKTGMKRMEKKIWSRDPTSSRPRILIPTQTDTSVCTGHRQRSVQAGIFGGA